MARRGDPWLRLGWNTWALGLESSSVIGLRTAKIALGGAAGDEEARRMISEKIDAGFELQLMALSGALGFTPAGAAARTVSHYRRRVRANRRRLSKA